MNVYWENSFGRRLMVSGNPLRNPLNKFNRSTRDSGRLKAIEDLLNVNLNEMLSDISDDNKEYIYDPLIQKFPRPSNLLSPYEMDFILRKSESTLTAMCYEPFIDNKKSIKAKSSTNKTENKDLMTGNPCCLGLAVEPLVANSPRFAEHTSSFDAYSKIACGKFERRMLPGS